MLMLLIGGALLAVAAYVGLDAITVRQRQLALSLRRAKRYGGLALREVELGKNVGDRMLAPTMDRLAGFALRLPGTISPDELRRRLIAAGMGNRISPTAFLAGKSAAALACFTLGFLLLLTGQARGL